MQHGGHSVGDQRGDVSGLQQETEAARRKHKLLISGEVGVNKLMVETRQYVVDTMLLISIVEF